jgi:hypothetical protein
MARKAGRAGIRIIDGGSGKKPKPSPDKACPACGAPGGARRCDVCGWGVEEMGPDISASLTDPVSTIIHARMSYSDLRRESKELARKVKSLLDNNRKFSELVEAMEQEIKVLRTEAGKKYVYKYGMGGWRQVGDTDYNKLHLKERVSVEDINAQLREIMRMLKRYEK